MIDSTGHTSRQRTSGIRTAESNRKHERLRCRDGSPMESVHHPIRAAVSLPRGFKLD